MPLSIKDVAAQIHATVDPLPGGIRLWIDYTTDSILIGNNDWAFAITRKAIADNLHILYAQQALPELLKCMTKIGLQFEDALKRRESC